VTHPKKILHINSISIDMKEVISHQILELMVKEFGPLGEKILEKQCKEMGVMPDDISLEDVDELSEKIFGATRYFAGIERSQKIKSHIRKYKLIRQLQDLEKLAPDDIKHIKKCKLLLQLGLTTTNNLGDIESALEYYNQALEIAENLGRKDLQSKSLWEMCFAHLEGCDLEKAQDAAERGLERCEDDTCETAAECKRGLALCYWRKGEYEKSLDILSEVKDIYEKLDDKSGIAYVHKNFGDIYGEMENFDESLENYLKSAEIYQNEDNYIERTTIFNNIGVLYSIQKDWKNAAKYYNRSKEIARKRRLPNRLGWTLFNLGEAYTYLHEFEKAENAFEESMDIFENQDDPMGKAGVNIKYGQMHVEKGKYEEAISLLESGIESLRKYQVPRYLADAIHELGKAFAKLGRTEKAREQYDEALEIYTSINNESRAKTVKDDLQELTKSLK